MSIANTTILRIIIRELLDVRMDYTVADSIPFSAGKYPAALGNIVVVDALHLLSTFLHSFCLDRYTSLIEQYSDLVMPSTRDLLRSFRISEYALLLVVTSSKRQEMYFSTSEGRNQMYIDFTNRMFESMGLDYPCQSEVCMEGSKGSGWSRVGAHVFHTRGSSLSLWSLHQCQDHPPSHFTVPCGGGGGAYESEMTFRLGGGGLRSVGGSVSQ